MTGDNPRYELHFHGLVQDSIAVDYKKVTEIFQYRLHKITPPHQLPPDLKDFTSRQAEGNRILTQLQQVTLTGEIESRISIVTGMAGVGKSTLALHVAHQLKSDFPDAQLTFGSGGGVAGLVNDFTLLENGQLFKRSSKDNVFVALKGAKKDAVSQAFKNFSFLGLDQMDVNQPGNLYYFIEHKAKDGTTRKLVWGNGESPDEDKLKLYYKLLSSLIPKD